MVHPYPSSRYSFKIRVFIKNNNVQMTIKMINLVAFVPLLIARIFTFDELAQNRSIEAKTIKYGERNGHALPIY